MEPYVKLAEIYGYTVFTLVVENRHNGENIHGAPEETIRVMERNLKYNIRLR